MSSRLDYDIVSLDLDGTLVDTAAEIAEAANRTLESLGIARRPFEEIVQYIGAGTHELMRRVLAAALAEQPERAEIMSLDEVFARLDQHYADTTGTTAQPYPGAGEALAQLKAAGVRLACTTNKEFRHATRLLEILELTPWFDLVIGGDSLPIKKPDAGVLRHVTQTLGGDISRTAHLGDSETDVLAAHNAGVAAWAVPYGYNAGRPIKEANPDILFPDLLSVADYVLRNRLET